MELYSKRKFALKLIIFSIIINFFVLSFSVSYAQKMDEYSLKAYENLLNKNLIPENIKKHQDFRDNITRVEFTHLIVTYLLSNKEIDMKNLPEKFTDVNDNFVNLAVKLNIVDGYQDGRFKPDYYISRAEACLIIYNAENIINNLDKGNINDLKKYLDYRFIPNWALTSISSLTKNNIINGYSNNMFKPMDNLRIQDAFIIINNLIKNKKIERELFKFADDDKYLSKSEYELIMTNIPIAKFTKENVQKSVFETNEEDRIKVYEKFKKTVPFSKNAIETSPNLIFNDGRAFYIVGIEKKNSGKKFVERVFMSKVYLDNFKLDDDISFSPWFTIQR